ncbi:MAG TPA: CBS domain-containing protein [Gammaproteobacteria bacterium]
MSIGSICNHSVATISSDAGIVEAARRMREEHVGDLVVVELRGGITVPIGIVTDRDIVVSVVAKQVSPADLTVADVMSSSLLKVNEQSGVEHALQEMHRGGVRRAPVVGARGELVGILSVDDVIERLAAQLDHVAGLIHAEQQREVRVRP